MIKTAVPIQFYECPWLAFDEAIDPCDAPLYDWLVSLNPRRPHWTPQRVEEIRIYAGVMQAIVDAHASCEAGKFAPQPAPQSGVSVSVAARLDNGGAGAAAAKEGLRSRVTVDFSPPPPGCGTIPFHVLNVPAVGGSYYPENTVFEVVSTTTPPKNGVGNFADTIIPGLVDPAIGWRQHIHQVFTTGTWRIRSPKVFAHYADWSPAGDPEPSAGLLARGEAFDGGLLAFDMPDFPDMGNPRWLVIHRYRHQQSGRYFYLSEWMTQASIQGATWPTAPYGRGFQGVVAWSDFEAPDDGNPAFFDPEGTWVRQSGVLDFAMTGVQVQAQYAGDLCEEAFRTISPLSIPDMMEAAFLSPEAYWEEEVEVRTIRQYKACYRITDIQSIDGVGIRVTAKLINPFGFAACIVARMPFGSGSKFNGNASSFATVVIARNLAANSESGAVDFVLSLIGTVSYATSTIDYMMSDVVYDGQNGGGIAEHAFACASGTYPDGEYITAIASDASALAATAGNKAEAWAFFNQSGTRFWSQAASHSGAATDVVFSFATQNTVPALSEEANGQAFLATLQVTGEWWNGSSWSVPQPAQRLIGFTGAEARSRYGTYLNVSPAAGKLAWGLYPVFDSWPGGNHTECAQGLLDKMVSDGDVRNVTDWSVIVKPRLLLSGGLLAPDDYPSGPPVIGGPPLAVVCADYLDSSTVKVCLR